MSQTTTDIIEREQDPAGGGDGGSDNGHGEHPPFLAHHFDTPQQQFDSVKLGIWLFLATEILMFGGLFCAYAIYRGNHPQVFLYAHTFLETKWGAINTIILLASSFTMAWGVRASMLNQRKLLIWMLALTFLGGLGFMGVKTIEYGSKWKHGLFPGWINSFYFSGGSPTDIDKLGHAVEYGEHHDEAAGRGDGHGSVPHGQDAHAADHAAADGVHAAHEPAVAESAAPAQDGPTLPDDRSKILPAAIGPAGTAAAFLVGGGEEGAHDTHAKVKFEELTPIQKERTHIFFQIYFLMTGLHGLHVLIGMGLIAWIGIKAMGGAFSSAYFTPVDIVGLYWHLVDLIWIFLFPLLYLIH